MIGRIPPLELVADDTVRLAVDLGQKLFPSHLADLLWELGNQLLRHIAGSVQVLARVLGVGSDKGRFGRVPFELLIVLDQRRDVAGEALQRRIELGIDALARLEHRTSRSPFEEILQCGDALFSAHEDALKTFLRQIRVGQCRGELANELVLKRRNFFGT